MEAIEQLAGMRLMWHRCVAGSVICWLDVSKLAPLYRCFELGPDTWPQIFSVQRRRSVAKGHQGPF